MNGSTLSLLCVVRLIWKYFYMHDKLKIFFLYILLLNISIMYIKQINVTLLL